MFNLNKKQQKKLSLFAICLFISFLVWSLFALSNRYIYTVKASLNYVNVPPKRAFHPLQSDTVAMQVEGTGWQVLFSNLRLKPQDIHVDLSGLKTRDWILFSNQMGYINRQFSANQRIVSISPDTLFFNFSKQDVKKVTVNLSKDIKFRKQYDIIGDIQIEPKFVTVTGPLEDLVLIDGWATDTLRRNNVDNTIIAKVTLSKSQKANINVHPSSVDVTIPVGEVTEKIIEVPIRAENSKAFRTVKVLPEKVRLTTIVSLDKYEDIDRDMFEAVINLNDWRSNHIKNLPVIITKQPDFVKIIKAEPQNVEFLLWK
jgi:YbbR domain-containing protein